MLISGELTVYRQGQTLQIKAGEAIFTGDQMSNSGVSETVVEMNSQTPELRPAILKLLPGASAQLLPLQASVPDQTSAKVIALSDDGVILDGEPLTPEEKGTDPGIFGLFGGGFLAADGGPLATVAAAGGLLLFSGDEDAGDDVGPPNDSTIPPPTPADQSDGLAGAVDSVSEGFAKTPASPLSDVLEPVAIALTDVGSVVVAVGENDPSGAISGAAEIVGVSQPGGGTSDSGVVGALNAVASGVESGGENTPLAPVSEPAAGFLGSDEGQTTGLAAAVSSLGMVIAQDDSALGPVTAGLVGPIVGGSEDDSQGGLPAALDEVGEGAKSLIAEDSALSPLATVGESVLMVVEPVSEGLSQAGQALDENRDAEPIGLVDLLAEVFGAPTERVEPDQAPKADSTTSGLAGAVADVDAAMAQTALEPLTVVTSPAADTLLLAGESLDEGSEQEPTGTGQAVADVIGNEETESAQDSGVVGAINAVARGVESSGEDTPVALVSDPVAGLLGSDDGETSGVALVVAEVSGVIANDPSELSPLTVEVLGPLLGTSQEDPEGVPGALDSASSAVSNVVAGGELDPANPLVDLVNTAVDQLSGGLRSSGEVLADNATQDPSGSVALLAELLGAEVARPAPDPEPEPSSSSRIGLAGLVQDLGTGADQTPGAPVVNITESISLALLSTGDGLNAASTSEPTGTVKLVANVVGTSESKASEDSGLSGGLNALAAGVEQGVMGNPVEPIVIPVVEIAGSRGGESTGGAAAVGAVGESLALDSSAASPVTSDLVAPLVGQSAGVSSGVPSATDKLADAVSSAGREGAIAPAAPLTEPVSMALKAVSSGGRGIGKIVSAQAQEDPSGVSTLVADLVGGGRGPGRPISRREVGDDGFDASSLGLDSLN